MSRDKGYDAFLLEEPALRRVLRGFMDGAAEYYGLPTSCTA